MRTHVLALSILTFLALTGCDTNYWWSRGQPPAPTTLLARSQERLDDELKKKDARQEIGGAVNEIRASLLETSDLLKRTSSGSGPDLAERLSALECNILRIEDKVTVTSKPPLTELAGQLRAMKSNAASGNLIDSNAFDLFAARVLFFFAGELALPAPAPAPAGSDSDLASLRGTC